MRPFQFSRTSAQAYGGVLEKIERLRVQFRWSDRLERADIRELSHECNALRGEMIQLMSLEQRLKSEAQAAPQPTGQRRQALIERDFVFEGIFGDNPKLLEALELAEKVARTELPVLIQGESGTGKELMAHALHANSARADGPFISLNCGAIPEELLESELFGHKKGAFTGANTDRKGKFESANHGTLFLDEIGELPLPGQVKLLRALQSHEIQRVGSDDAIRVDTRIVAATNRDLLSMVQEGSFREDLYYRLNVIELALPPLRERGDEIPLLIDFFCAEAAQEMRRQPLQLAPALHRFLLRYAYPGNVRELRNLIFRMSCLAAETADLSHLPASLKADAEAAPTESADAIDKQSLIDAKKAASEAAERAFLEQGLTAVGGKVVDLAQRVGMNRSHLQTMLKKHGLSARDFRCAS